MIDFSAFEGHQDMLPPGNAAIARLRADAVDLLTQLDAREGLHTQKVLPLPSGMWNALYRLEPAGIVAKLSAMENDFEVNFLRAAGSLTLPVPHVLGAGKLNHAALPNATYFLMTYISNSANAWIAAHTENGMPAEALRRLGHDLGQALARLHSVHQGHVTRFSTRVERWQQVLTDGFSPDWDHIAPNALFDETLLPIFKAILKKTDYFSFTDGTLVHGDLVLSDVLVDTETYQLKAIIDPAGYAGMPMFDLAYAAIPWDHGAAFSQAMVKSYMESSDKFDLVLYAVSILVVAYRHERFHTQAVRDAIFKDILPYLNI